MNVSDELFTYTTNIEGHVGVTARHSNRFRVSVNTSPHRLILLSLQFLSIIIIFLNWSFSKTNKYSFFSALSRFICSTRSSLGDVGVGILNLQNNVILECWPGVYEYTVNISPHQRLASFNLGVSLTEQRNLTRLRVNLNHDDDFYGDHYDD